MEVKTKGYLLEQSYLANLTINIRTQLDPHTFMFDPLILKIVLKDRLLNFISTLESILCATTLQQKKSECIPENSNFNSVASMALA